jgi:hypothetical protein
LQAEDANDAKETVARQTRLKEKKQVESMLDVLNDRAIPVQEKFAQVYSTLKSAMLANNWQQRSMFADCRRRSRDDSDDEDGTDAYNDGGVLDCDAAQILLDQEVAEDAALVAKKPYACRLCNKRYVKPTGLKNHIAAKHSYPEDPVEPDAMVASSTCAAQASGVNDKNIRAAAPSSDTGKVCKVCPICGGNANHKSKHDTTQRHKTALEKLK